MSKYNYKIKPLNILSLFFFLIILTFSSCKVSKTVVSIDSGGLSNNPYTENIEGIEATSVEVSTPRQEDILSKPDIETIMPKNTSITIAFDKFTDSRDLKEYKTIKFGDQVWMTENLKYNAKQSKCYYNNDSNCEDYGRLYTYDIAKTVCPNGWRLPSKDDYKVLIEFIRDNKSSNKQIILENSKESNRSILENFFISTKLGGYAHYQAEIYKSINIQGFWWTSTQYNRQNTISINFESNNSHVVVSPENNKFGFSVRCIKD